MKTRGRGDGETRRRTLKVEHRSGKTDDIAETRKGRGAEKGRRKIAGKLTGMQARFTSQPAMKMTIFQSSAWAIGVALAAGNLAGAKTQIPNAAQPQLAVSAEGRVWVVYGRMGA